MTTATLSRSPAILTVALPAEPSQADWEAAMDWVSRNAAPGQPGTLVDHGDQLVWLFPAA